MPHDAAANAPHPELAPPVLQEIYAHARETYPEECCGFLMGPSDTAQIDEVRRCVNEQNLQHEKNPDVFTRTARNAYHIGDQDMLFLAKSLGQSRPVKIVYHSHPDVGAYFSETDTAAALNPFEPDDPEPLYPIDYIVIDAQSDHIAGAKLFCWDSVKKSFVETATYDGERHGP